MAAPFLLILFLLPPTTLAASGFSPPFSTFLACGASSDISFPSDTPQRTFLPDGDALSGSSSRQSTAVSNSNGSPPSPLYAAARASKEGFSYRIKYPASAAPSGNTTLVLRLHFFPFASPSGDLSSSRFSVSALGRYLLLPSFSLPRAGVVREFFLPSDGSGAFDLDFTPEAGLFAFVNAVELFPAPPELLWNSVPTTVNNATVPPREALATLYRLNVGGPAVTKESDTMWRTWLPDGGYLSPATASAVDSTTQNIVYDPAQGWTRMVAPDAVYKTQRTTSNASTTASNVTWTFAVNGGAEERACLVRLHFCAYEVLSSVVGAGLDFNVYVMHAVATRDLAPKSYASLNMPTQAFYIDYVTTVPKGGGNLTVSIGRAASNDSNKAILNGLEIMQLQTADLTPPANSSSDGMKKVIILVPVLGVALLASILLCVFFMRRRQRKALQTAPEKEKESTALTPWSPYTLEQEGSLTARRVNMKLHIPLADIMAATRGFHSSNLIGVGGFGNVYSGVLPDGTRVAVKRGKPASRQGLPEFQTEILVLSSIRHRHLVSLIGYCNDRSEMILVYEHMANGTLRSHLYGSDADAPPLPPLSWKQRLEICVGAARGLHYLHAGNAENIIHRDVKSTNILLGDGLVARVADFGLSRVGPSMGQTHVSTAVKGSFGYLDPEYFKTRQLTDRSDVYSFGVVLLEVLCARPVIDQTRPPDEINLAEWAMHWARRGQLDRIVDPAVAAEANENSLRKFAETAERCLANYGEERPTMGDVVWNLEYCLQLQESQQAGSVAFEDSGTHLPGDIVARGVPLPVSLMYGEDRSWTDSTTSSLTATANVFSQIITGDGR